MREAALVHGAIGFFVALGLVLVACAMLWFFCFRGQPEQIERSVTVQGASASEGIPSDFTPAEQEMHASRSTGLNMAASPSMYKQMRGFANPRQKVLDLLDELDAEDVHGEDAGSSGSMLQYAKYVLPLS